VGGRDGKRVYGIYLNEISELRLVPAVFLSF